ncbi:phosphinothricin acetyltransferase [Lutibacter sp. Hel_I_33_5]|uniref:GNAT family N-acetyltransferase n=1 Tax=Lutibacter sp. Hel_I_33_5 TaxID=1566289 RepID=UPI0011A8A6A0|nr:GNAT family N-acetyltransferase [Lutibacter sp. Hel_I_33_5]TVZ56237.1 phosphinothricin acetyltransferase [Lutibacter sp. Hel_I_33_5]
MLRNVTLQDAEAIKEIYNYYVETSVANLEEHIVDLTYIENQIETITKDFPWLVFEDENEIVGFAYASSWKNRSGYNKTAQVTVYLKNDVTKKGIGSQLYKQLIDRLEKTDLHVLIGGISLPNEASVRLHEKFGFEKVAHFKQTGFKFNKWVDVGYWQLIINQNKK